MELAAKTIAQKTEAQPALLAKLRGWQMHGLALLFFVLLTFWLTWPVCPTPGVRSNNGATRCYKLIPSIGTHTPWLLTRLHLFNANAFYPYQNSLAFSESLIGQAFLVTPLIWLTDNPVLGYQRAAAAFVCVKWLGYVSAGL